MAGIAKEGYVRVIDRCEVLVEYEGKRGGIFSHRITRNVQPVGIGLWAFRFQKKWMYASEDERGRLVCALDKQWVSRRYIGQAA